MEVNSENKEDDVKRSYLNQRLTGAFSLLSGFMKNRKQWNDKNAVEKELRKLSSYALHKPVRKKFKRRRVHVYFINETLSIDLKDLQSLSRYNRGYKHVLGVVDAFSKYAWVRPIKDKKATTVVKALNSILKEINDPPVRFL